MIKLSRRSLVLSGLASGLLRDIAYGQENPPTTTPAPPKPKQFSIAQQLEHTSILLRTEDGNRQQFSATGFIFNFFQAADQSVTAIVTNRHVVAGMKKIKMRWTVKKPSNEPDYGNFVDVVLENFQGRVIEHPDPAVDLAIIFVGDVLTKYQNESRPIYAVGSNQSIVASEADLKKFQPLEEVVIIGYPDGISDTTNNIPIFRRGVTATPVYMRFNGQKQFMIDAAIYHGSSGSPVFLYNVGAWIDENGTTQLGTRASLLGVVYGVIESATEGEIRILPAPTQTQSKVLSMIPHNLGACVSSYCILDFEPEIVKRGYKPPDGYKMRAQP